MPYGPYENVGRPYEKPSIEHPFGTDQIGRDVLSRMIYGARISLAVGILATGMALLLGTFIGMAAGYFGGRTDLIVMRFVEIIICFPTFLLLLILMSIIIDYKISHSILLVIVVIGLTGWTGLSRLVRGEVLKQRILPYIRSCEALGLPVWRIMFYHLLPNITGPILVSFTFGVAGAIIAESGLSFLGFGVQDPTSSWGELLRQAFANPFSHWHLTLWPGLALFFTVCAFNFTGEGLRKVLSPRA
jgi:peptide/nickel transport system permease protein